MNTINLMVVNGCSTSSQVSSVIINYITLIKLGHQVHEVYQDGLSISSSSSSLFIKLIVFIKSTHQVLMNLTNRQRGRLRAVRVRVVRVHACRVTAAVVVVVVVAACVCARVCAWLWTAVPQAHQLQV
jgi:hypothetical protein